jgi:hypothetical protein
MPPESRSTLDDIRHFFLHRPQRRTLVEMSGAREREDMAERIAQRIGIDVEPYSVLNVHQIGIEAPVWLVFDEIARWSGQSPAWPNHVATVEGLDENRERVRITLLGDPSGRAHGRAWRVGARLRTLFNMRLVDVHAEPAPEDQDNARYLVWECSGGYPIGVFSIYARSAIPSRGETEPTQLFFAVGFNPYGRRLLSAIHPVRLTWEAIHNRVTGNILNRFKAMCEVRFAELRSGS